MTFGSLFAGIGGLDLGLERAGMQCSWQVEIDPFCQQVLAKHWPEVRRHDDIKTFPPTDAKDWHVDLICGGFPCQDISIAGKGAGLAGERSGLWFEYARVIRELRPTFIVVENVAALLVRGLDAVLGTLASLGYDAEWSCVSACAMGAPQMRKRLFIVAYPAGFGWEWRRDKESSHAEERRGEREFKGCVSGPFWAQHSRPETVGLSHGIPSGLYRDLMTPPKTPNRRKQLKGLGNSVVPQIAELIGRKIMGN